MADDKPRLGDRFKRPAHTTAPAPSALDQLDRLQASEPAPPPAADPAAATSRRRVVYLPTRLIDQLRSTATAEGSPQPEIVLRAIEQAVTRNIVGQLAAAPVRSHDNAAGTAGGELFPRQTAAAAEPARNHTLGFRVDHLATIDRIAADHQLSRSRLIALTLDAYLNADTTRT